MNFETICEKIRQFWAKVLLNAIWLYLYIFLLHNIFSTKKGGRMGLKEIIDQLQAELAAVSAETTAAYDKGFEDGKVVGKQEGFQAGVDSCSLEIAALKAEIEELKKGDPSKKYSEEELQAKIAEAVLPLQEQISALQVVVDNAQADKESAVIAAKAGLKAELLAQYEAQQVAESQGETGFLEMLK